MLSKVLRSHFFQIFAALILGVFCHGWIPLEIKRGFLTISLLIRESLIFMIPLLIFSSTYTAFSKMRGQAIFLMVLLIGCVMVSNFLSVNIAGIFSYFVLFDGGTGLEKLHKTQELSALFDFKIPILIPNYAVLIISFILGLSGSEKADWVNQKLRKIVDIFFNKFFVPVLPLFIFGFILKMMYEDVVTDIFWVNLVGFMLMILLLSFYLLLLFFLCVVLYKKNAKSFAKTLIEPGITAFTTMSSAAALPFSLKAAQENTNNKDVTMITIPITTNIHMIGDSICIPIIAMMILASSHQLMPSTLSYLYFAMSFTLTKFSGAGMPGGSILVMTPILESTLGFSPDMTALITILYMLIDPLTTLGNVIGNNIFVVHFNKLYQKISA